MTITTNHPYSSYGQPVILDGSGAVMGYPEGIRAIRETLAHTQAEFAQALGVTKSAVEKWESGVNMPSAKALNAIAMMMS